MKKALKIVLYIVIAFFLTYQIFNWTGIFTVYDNPTTSNIPTLELNSKMFSTNLIEPENGDFICYKSQDEMLGKHIRVHRLCGKENDIVEIKEGILFINGINEDLERDLMHFYTLSNEEYKNIKSEIHPDVNYISKVGKNKDSIMVLLSDFYAENNGILSRRRVSKKNSENQIVQKNFNEKWNLDHFGPLKIPMNKVFVLGDNRSISMDSRFVGLIDKSDIIGTIISK